MDDRKVAYQIIKFLQKSQEGSADIESAIAGISRAFGVDISSAEDFKQLSYTSGELPDFLQAGAKALSARTFEDDLAEVSRNSSYAGFFEKVKNTTFFDGVEEGSAGYLERHAKLLQKFKAKLEAGKPKAGDPEAERTAELKKQAGNDAIKETDYNAAVRLYTEAIELSPNGPNSHIYFSNRAAAHCFLTSYDLAIEDAKECIKLNPGYAKGWSRLGQANFSLNNFDAAVEAYKKCIELEPKDKSHKDALSRAKQKAQQHKGSMASGGDFDMSSLAGALKGGQGGLTPGMMQNPALQKAAKEMMAGGGLDALMKNPAMMQMAQQMMQNPAMMQQAMSMLGGGAGGGGPDLGALAGMLGGLGGNSAGSGLAAPGSGAFFEDDHDAASSSSSRL